ncbi:MAG: hypothetical protein GXO10_07045 [Crenarchaeota archaeon]|nr:hypothetical protein [Thermoproteota archaeon]
MKIDRRCLVCPIGPRECVRRIIEKYWLRPRRLRPGHPWTAEWCPYLRGFRPEQKETAQAAQSTS